MAPLAAGVTLLCVDAVEGEAAEGEGEGEAGAGLGAADLLRPGLGGVDVGGHAASAGAASTGEAAARHPAQTWRVQMRM